MKTYHAIDDDALRNGSYYRTDGPPRPNREHLAVAARYMNGDFMGTVQQSSIPAGLKSYSRDDARELLPKSCK